MNRSEQINELALALSKAQAEMKAPQKDRTAGGQAYSYRYADLSTIIESAREALSKNGLSISQLPQVQADNFVLLTVLMHSSGQFLESSYLLPKVAKAQEMGSAITYARRYSLCAVLGISAEDDDDGKRAQGVAHKPQPKHAPQSDFAPGEDFFAGGIFEGAQVVSDAPGDYEVPFGKKYKGRALKDIPAHEIAQYITWLQADAHKKGEPLSGAAQELVEKASAFLQEIERNSK